MRKHFSHRTSSLIFFLNCSSYYSISVLVPCLHSHCLRPAYFILALHRISSKTLTMPDRSARRASFDSAPDNSRTSRDQPPTPRQYQTFSPASSRSRDVAQDRHMNGMMGFGRRRLVVSPSPNEVEQSVTNRSDAASTQYHSARSSQGAASSLRESPRHTEASFETAFEESATVRITPDPPLRLLALYSGNERASTLPARGARNLARSRPLRPSSPSITIAEAFYRSSRPQNASVEERRTIVRLHRPLTPYPGNIPPVPSRPARPHATFPLPSSPRQEYIDDPALSYEPPSPTKRPPQPTRPPPSPPLRPKRLPADYRAETPFSFNREPTPTPFETKDARAMTPSHPLYNAPRTGGVDLELRAMGRSLGRDGAKLHRTMWPEEIGEMAGNVSDMVTNLVRTSGAVRDGEPKVDGVVEQKAEEEKTSKLDEVEEQKVDKKKGRFKWLKKLLVKKNQMTEPEKNSPAQRTILETDTESPPFGPSSDAEPQTLRYDWRYLPSTTAIANCTPTSTDTTPSKPPQDEPARNSTKKPARSNFGRQLSRKQAWWHIRLPRANNRMSKAKMFKGATGYVRESQIHRSVPRSRMSIGTRTSRRRAGYARIPTESRLSVRQGGSRRVATHPSQG
jgi:hypothetical protein